MKRYDFRADHGRIDMHINEDDGDWVRFDDVRELRAYAEGLRLATVEYFRACDLRIGFHEAGQKLRALAEQTPFERTKDEIAYRVLTRPSRFYKAAMEYIDPDSRHETRHSVMPGAEHCGDPLCDVCSPEDLIPGSCHQSGTKSRAALLKDARSVLRVADRSDAWRAERDRVVAAIDAALAE